MDSHPTIIMTSIMMNNNLGALSYRGCSFFVLFDSFNTIKIKNTKEFEEGGALLPVFTASPTDNQ